MSHHPVRTGKQSRPKTAVKGKRYLCAKCRKRSPRPVMTPAPWYCPKCLAQATAADAGSSVETQSMRDSVVGADAQDDECPTANSRNAG
jgi:ribosomal protein L37AE/L43A